MWFWLNGEQVEVREAADATLLRGLREACARTGTKEGCASGDCGACTVLVSEPDGSYRAVNSCLTPLAAVAGRSVLSVEGLAQGGQLHPVQQSLVDAHASQCGFCTPGFAMSLAGLHQQGVGAAADARGAVLDAISGNLCRCTGYKPIVEAGLQALGRPACLPAGQCQPQALADPQPAPGYWRPDSEAELRALLAEQPDARLIAGGTDLMLEVTQLYRQLPQLIDLSGIASLTRVDGSGDTLRLGAALTYTDLEAALADLAPALVALLGRLGSRQIRNRGTLGGNLCNASPVADTPPWLLVQEAELVIGTGSGYRYERLEDFYRGYKQTSLAPGEYLAEVRLSRARLGWPTRLYKVCKRWEDDIAAVSAAFLLAPDGRLRIAYGGLAAVPRRARATEACLNGLDWRDAGRLDAALDAAGHSLGQEFAPLTDVRASADYRAALARQLLAKALRAFALGEQDAQEEFSHA